MRLVKRILLGIGLALAAITYVWVAAVHAVPGVKRRKAAARAARQARRSPG